MRSCLLPSSSPILGLLSGCLLLASCAMLTGCTSRVRLELPASPAVALHTDTVAVVANDRACQQAADAVALELTKSSYLAVDPRSSLRIELLGCAADQALTMEQEQSEDGHRRSRVRVETRAHAAVSVSEHGRVLAHLIAAGEDEGASPWSTVVPLGRGRPLVQARQQASRRVQQDLARDIVQQLNPLPTLVSRKVWPNAPAGTARELTTLAVLAEQQGDLGRALELAQAAWQRDPNPRTASYIEELKRRLSEIPQ